MQIYEELDVVERCPVRQRSLVPELGVDQRDPHADSCETLLLSGRQLELVLEERYLQGVNCFRHPSGVVHCSRSSEGRDVVASAEEGQAQLQQLPVVLPRLAVLDRVLVHLGRLAFELPEFAAEHFLGSSSKAVLIDEGPATLESFEEGDIGALRSSHHGGEDGGQDEFVGAGMQSTRSLGQARLR